MMSGFEIAGVILGAIPVIVTALQQSQRQYNGTKQKLSLFKNKVQCINGLIDSLQYQKMMIASDLAVLLRAAAGPVLDDLSSIDVSEYSQLLERGDVQKCLENYLGERNDPIRKILTKCEDLLKDIAARIGGCTSGSLIHSGDLKKLSQSNLEKSGKLDIKKKIRFSLGKEGFEQRIKELNDSTSMLNRLCASCTAVPIEETASMSKSGRRLSLRLSRVRSHSQSLHSAFTQEWKSKCHAEHKVFLFLDDHSDSLRAKKTPLILRVGLPSTDIISSVASWHETHIEEAGDSMHESLRPPSPSPSQLSGTRRVRIDLPPQTMATRLKSVCGSVDDGRKRNECLRLSLSNQGILFQPQTPSRTSKAPRNFTGPYINLESLLKESPDSEPPARRWICYQQISLAYKIVSILLQYHSTPWLQAARLKQSIFFQSYGDAGSKPSTHVETDQPFVTHSFVPNSATTSLQNLNIKNSLLDLGILLLEIFHGESFEAFAKKEQMIIDGSYEQQCKVARQWMNSSDKGLLPPVSDAVQRCIECAFNRKTIMPDWDDEEFRISFCEGVIKPLWNMSHSQS